MHNIKDIRDNLDNFKKLISKRNVKVETNNISELDKQNRTLIQNKELLEKEKKDISKKKDQNLFEKSKEISKKIEKISSDQSQVKFKLDEILSSIPFNLFVVGTLWSGPATILLTFQIFLFESFSPSKACGEVTS